MPANGGFELTSQDVAILRLVHDYRMVRADHLAALTGRPEKKVRERLVRLRERRYLARRRLPLQRDMYFLGSAGVPVLVAQGLAPKELLDARLRHHELKDLFLAHLRLVVDVHAILALATRGAPIRLVAWKEGQPLWDTVEVRQAGKRERLPVRPDGFFALDDANRPVQQNRRHFFLEADRSTMAHERFARKLTAYWHYLVQKRHTARYGIQSFRVVTVAITPERAANLCALAEETLPADARKFFLFTSTNHFSLAAPDAILADVFLAPHSRAGGRHALMPAPVLAPFTAAPARA